MALIAQPHFSLSCLNQKSAGLQKASDSCFLQTKIFFLAALACSSCPSGKTVACPSGVTCWILIEVWALAIRAWPIFQMKYLRVDLELTCSLEEYWNYQIRCLMSSILLLAFHMVLLCILELYQAWIAEFSQTLTIFSWLKTVFFSIAFW